ncbi:hypothetical protein B0H21DRAFT_889765 [Amylocystis lapponica]|nr:hypothetical protein B0H21DRAFT_889765 [Amylocystis lapponica]
MASPLASSSSHTLQGSSGEAQPARDPGRGNGWIGGSSVVQVDQQAVSSQSPLLTRGDLLPPFGSVVHTSPLSSDTYPRRPKTRESHLPTPQSSPNNVEDYAMAHGLPPESPLPSGSQRARADVLQFISHHTHRAAEARMLSSVSFITPESSPVMPRKMTLSRPPSASATSPASPSIFLSPFTPRRDGPSRTTAEIATTPLSQGHAISPHASSREITPSPRLSSPFMDRLTLIDGPEMTPTPNRSHTNSAVTSSSPQPTGVDDIFTTNPSVPSTPPALPAPVPQRAMGGEIQRIRLQLAADQAARLHETESRRPDYLVREKRSSLELDPAIDELPEAEDEDSLPGLGVTVSPNKGRRLKLFQETSEESFEQSLLAGGYPGYGYTPAYAEPHTPTAKEKPGLSQRAVQWLQQSTPGRPGPSSAVLEQEPDWVPSEKEIRKRKRLAAFQDHAAASEPPAKLHPVEIKGKGRLIMNVPAEDLPAHVESSSRRRGGRRKRRGANTTTTARKRGTAESLTDDAEVLKPNWLDTAFPWCMRAQERAEAIRLEQEEKLKWIERFLDRVSDEEDSDGEPQEAPAQTHEEAPPPRRGRGKMVPLQANPSARHRNDRTVMLPTDPADARAALLSKRSVRALAFRRKQERGITDSLDGEIVCLCHGTDDGRPLVQCDDCHTWYHLDCIGVEDVNELGDEDDPWYCSDCLGVPMTSDPVSEPTLVPTDERPTRDPSHDPLFYQMSLQESPTPAMRTPGPPLRHRDQLFSSRSSRGDLSTHGPSTPPSSEQHVQVYTPPGLFDRLHESSPFDPNTTPSRGIKFGVTTPKAGLWAARPGVLAHSPTRYGRESWRQSGGSFPFYDSGGPSFSPYRNIYSYDDTPVRRAPWPRDETRVTGGRRLWDSPLPPRHMPLPRSPLQGSHVMATEDERSHLGLEVRREQRGEASASTSALGHEGTSGATVQTKRPVLRCVAYVLDLCAKFPCPDAAAFDNDPWRKRALQLEHNLQELQAKFDSERIELLSLRDTQPLPAESYAPLGCKKKQKKKTPAPVRASPRPDLRSILSGLDVGSGLPEMPATNRVLSALETLDRLVSTRTIKKSAVSDDLFVTVTMRALEALGELLASMLPPNTSLPPYLGTLDVLATLLSRLLATVLPLLLKLDRGKRKPGGVCPRTADVLTRTSALLLAPLVRSLGPLSKRYLTELFSPQKRDQRGRSQTHAVDIRPSVLTLLSSTVSVMGELMLPTAALATCALDIRHMLTLEAVRELQRVLSQAHRGPDVVAGEQSTSAHVPAHGTERIRKLIRKDAVWYLCSVLHLTLPTRGIAPANGTDLQEDRTALLEEAIYTTTSAVLRGATAADVAGGRSSPVGPKGSTGRSCYEMEEVERGMILAVAERLWLGT